MTGGLSAGHCEHGYYRAQGCAVCAPPAVPRHLIALTTRAERHGSTGIFVRARNQEGKWGSYDIAELERESLLAWLRKDIDLAERVVLALLEHAHE
jgi:hypothetical protein